MGAIVDVSRRIPVVFPCHPRTRQALEANGIIGQIRGPAIDVIEPFGYRAMLGLLKSAKCVLTDSGGLQEETTALGIPCLTLRDNTERPITIEIGTNCLVGTEPSRILAAVDEVMAGRWKMGRLPDKWDGRASGRIAAILDKSF
jgi:UDP-N-acetylglucosamine 2-epimerase (non-hydrolysing)